MANKLQEISDKIDACHSIAIRNDGDSLEACNAAIDELIGPKDGPNAAIYEDLYDYCNVSLQKYNLAD